MSVTKIRTRWQSGGLEFYETVTGDVLLALRSEPFPYIDVPVGDAYDEAGSFQRLPVDMKFGAAAGTSTALDSDYLGAIMGNALADEALTKTRNIIAGVIGKFTIADCASLLPKAGVIGEAASKDAHAAVLALLSDGDFVEASTPRAMFGVCYMTGSQTGSKASYGLDLKGPASVAEADAVSYATGDILLQNGMVITNDKADRTMIGALIGVGNDNAPADAAPTGGVILFWDGSALKLKGDAGTVATITIGAFS